MDEFQRASEINDLYRTSAANRCYYAKILRRYRRWATASDAVVAIGSSTAIAAWTFLNNNTGQIVWQGIGGMAAVVGVLRPILKVSEEAQRYGELVTGYTAVVLELESIAHRIRTERRVTPEAWSQFKSADDRMRKIRIQEDPVKNQRLFTLCTDEVKRDIPMEVLWWPTRPQSDTGQ